MWVEDLMDVIFNIMQVEMGCVTFLSTQHDSFNKNAYTSTQIQNNKV